MALPIIATAGRGIALAGAISDASLLDVMTVTNRDAALNNGVGFRAGTVICIDSLQGDNYRGFTPGNQAITAGKLCGVAAFSHYEQDKYGNSNVQLADGYHQTACPTVTTGRIWVLAVLANVTVNAPVAISDPVALVSGGALVGGAVKVGAAGAAIPGWFFTGRVASKDANGFPVAEVQVRPQTA